MKRRISVHYFCDGEIRHETSNLRPIVLAVVFLFFPLSSTPNVSVILMMKKKLLCTPLITVKVVMNVFYPSIPSILTLVTVSYLTTAHRLKTSVVLSPMRFQNFPPTSCLSTKTPSLQKCTI